MRVLPHGTWPSPISAADVARATRRLSYPAVVGDEVWFVETRPDDGGRQVVVRADAAGALHDVLPAGWSARSLVHEYGGRPWLALPGPDGPVLVFVNWDDQRLYRLDPSAGRPVPLTDAPARPRGTRYVEPVPGPGNEILCVREMHHDDRVVRDIVAVPLDGGGAVRVVVSGSDFVAFPRLSPDGRHLAWLAWNHPRMPWDGCRLMVGALGDDGRPVRARTLLGGDDEAVFQPEWADDGSLYAVTDASGWWNLVRVDLAGAVLPLHPTEHEFGTALWWSGVTTYGILGDGRLAVTYGRDVWRLAILDPATGTLVDADLPYTTFESVHVAGATVTAVAGGPAESLSVLRWDTATGRATVLRPSADRLPDPAFLPVPYTDVLVGADGREVHAIVYPPRNPTVVAPPGELAPYVVYAHGGPTLASPVLLDLPKAYFTSRGIGVVDVNYGGSTGHGRRYRERLRGQWGVVDVEDCVAAVEALVARGAADPRRLAIRGHSAGGWTALVALTRGETFACGSSYFGIADPVRFATDTHDFESHYTQGLIGPLPERLDLYRTRAPLAHVSPQSRPVLLLHGDGDTVVPPSQAELLQEALRRADVPHELLMFQGEQHGFRRADTLVTALEAELTFFGRFLGFTPIGVPRHGSVDPCPRP